MASQTDSVGPHTDSEDLKLVETPIEAVAEVSKRYFSIRMFHVKGVRIYVRITYIIMYCSRWWRQLGHHGRISAPFPLDIELLNFAHWGKWLKTTSPNLKRLFRKIWGRLGLKLFFLSPYLFGKLEAVISWWLVGRASHGREVWFVLCVCCAWCLTMDQMLLVDPPSPSLWVAQ